MQQAKGILDASTHNLNKVMVLLTDGEENTNPMIADVLQDVVDANLISFVQEWDSREAMAEHIRSKDYRNILAVMELASEPPEIKFVEALNTDGMELIEEIRG